MQAYFKKHKGVVLDSVAIGERDVLLTVFTSELGKIQIVAKGAKDIKSKFASKILPASFGDFMLLNGFGLPTLIFADTVNPVAHMENIICRTWSIIALKLLDVLTPKGDKNEKIIDLIIDFFSFLTKCTETDRIKSAFFGFSENILSVLGWIDKNKVRVQEYNSLKKIIEWHTEKEFNFVW